MAARKNTQGAEDSLKGSPPEQAEAGSGAAQAVPAGLAAADPASLPPDAPEGSAGADGGPADPATATLMAAIAGIGANQAQITPPGTDLQLVRRIATAADTIIHDGVHFAPGDPVPVTMVDFAVLSAAGVLAEIDWDDLDPTS